jgi:hypothetical protein
VRHRSCSRRGIEPEFVQGVLGRATTAITVASYPDVTPSMEEQGASSIAALASFVPPNLYAAPRDVVMALRLPGKGIGHPLPLYGRFYAECWM